MTSSQITIMPFDGREPRIHPSVFMADGCRVIGDVQVGQDSSMWFNVVCRGDVNSIKIGSRTNIQDNSLIHVNHGAEDVSIGDSVTVGHQVILHGCCLHNHVLVGMGSTLLDGVEVGERSVVAAGSLLTPGKVFPSGVLIKGRPGKVVRDLTEDEIEKMIFYASDHYVRVKEKYLQLGFT